MSAQLDPALAAPALSDSDFEDSLKSPHLYLNRELSLLAFQRRVLEEAQDPRLPPLERLKFIAIVASNLSEFFMVRVAGLYDQAEAGVYEAGELSPSEQLKLIRPEVESLMMQSRDCLLGEILAALAAQGVRVVDYDDLTPDHCAAAEAYFESCVFPVLTPLGFDPGRPFPHISNLSLNLAVVVEHPDGVDRFARVKVPGTLPRLVPLGPQDGRPSGGEPHIFVWLEQLIAANLRLLFPGLNVREAHPFHVTRDADFAVQEIEADDLLESVAEGVRRRRFGSVVRLAVQEGMPQQILRLLMTNLQVGSREVYRLNGPLALNGLMSLYSIDRPDLKDAPIVAQVPRVLQSAEKDENVFAAVSREDVLLHHPYDSFQPVVDFLRQAARDPDVLAIKMTLYRVGRNSPVVEALLEAMENDKQVAVLVELKARFDEESNIEWAKALEAQGVHVVYGLVGLKIHAKIALVVRREGDRIRRYVHMSTGNYNAVTANLYTDLGFLTCDDEIGADATQLFNYLTGYAAEHRYRKLLVAPVTLRQRLEELIEREIEHARRGRPARLIFKTNSLVDRRMIRLLYLASRAGVRCDLLVRGICGLRPGLPGISENIRVISVVGRFLEHSRIYYFWNDGREEVYLGSADLMPRNLNFRVENVFPIKRQDLVRYVRDVILATYLADNVKARVMQPHGGYARAIPWPDEERVDSQTALAQSVRQAPALVSD